MYVCDILMKWPSNIEQFLDILGVISLNIKKIHGSEVGNVFLNVMVSYLIYYTISILKMPGNI